jgi:uncharacterized protein HemX
MQFMDPASNPNQKEIMKQSKNNKLGIAATVIAIAAAVGVGAYIYQKSQNQDDEK